MFEGHFGHFPNNTTERRAVYLRQLSFLLIVFTLIIVIIITYFLSAITGKTAKTI